MKIIKSLILTLVFAGAAYAGEMGQPFAPPPPPSAMTTGDMGQPLAPPSCSATSAEQTTENTLTELVIAIAQNLLRLY